MLSHVDEIIAITFKAVTGHLPISFYYYMRKMKIYHKIIQVNAPMIKFTNTKTQRILSTNTKIL